MNEQSSNLALQAGCQRAERAELHCKFRIPQVNPVNLMPCLQSMTGEWCTWGRSKGSFALPRLWPFKTHPTLMPCLQSMIGDELRSSLKAARSKQERQQVSGALHDRVHQHFGTAEPTAAGAVPAMSVEAVTESDVDEPATGAAEWAGQQATYSEVKAALKVRHLWLRADAIQLCAQQCSGAQ